MGVHGIDPDRQQNEHDADDGKERDLLIQYDDAADHGRDRLDEGGEGGLRRAGPGDADIEQQEAERGDDGRAKGIAHGGPAGGQGELAGYGIDDNKDTCRGGSHVEDCAPDRVLADAEVFIAKNVERVGKGRGQCQDEPRGLEAGDPGTDDRDKQQP